MPTAGKSTEQGAGATPDVSVTRSPEALVPATELTDLTVILQTMASTGEAANRPLLRHVLPLPLEKATVPEKLLPSALMVAVTSDVGQVTVRLPSSALSWVSEEVAETLALTGVSVAWAGVAAAATTASAATTSKPRRASTFIGISSLLVLSKEMNDCGGCLCFRLPP